MARQRRRAIAKVKLELGAATATPAPPVGRDLGPHGVNLAEFCRRYNDATRGQEGRVIPAEVTIYEDRSFDIRLKTPLTSALLGAAIICAGLVWLGIYLLLRVEEPLDNRGGGSL